MKELQKMTEDFLSDRPKMAENNTLARVFFLLIQEVDEVGEVIDDPKLIGGELADVIFFALTIANLHGIDMDEAFRGKVAFNHGRYQARYFQDGDYEEARYYVKTVVEPETVKDFKQVKKSERKK